MRPVWILLTMMGMLIIQSTVLQVQPFTFIAPNIPFVMLLFVALKRGPLYALYIGLCIGLLQDVLYGTYLGMHAFTYATIGYFAGTTFRSYWTRQFMVVVLIILGYTFLSELTAYGLSRLFGQGHYDLTSAMLQGVRMMIWNGIFALLLYSPSVRLLDDERRSGRTEESI
ncbi:MAG TPA: rod shape-determining protein MreD [Bacilli bacterium]|nr:rod shape-determining protein MreD [Bacilli bacterium]